MNLLVADNELLGRYLKKNDETAFEELVRRHSGMVIRVCRSMLLHSQDSEDAFQATFLVLSKKAHRLLDRNSIAGWLYEVAIRICLEVRRKKKKKRESAMIEEVCAKTNEPWHTISSAQEREKILTEIRNLPKRYRDAIVLCHIEGHSRVEAAELLNTTEISIKAALARGRNLLRQRLVRHGIIATVFLMSLKESIASASQSVSDPLIQSTIKLCQGTTPDLPLGSSPDFIQSIAHSGTQTMSNIVITKTTCAVLAAMIAIAIPVAIYAQQKTSNSDQHVISLTADEVESTEDKDTATVKMDFGSAVETAGKNPRGSEKVSDDTNVSAVGAGVTARTNTQKVVVQSPSAEYSIENSAKYWEMMRKSYDAKIKNELETGELYLNKAKLIEAELNLKRIKAGELIGTTTNGRQDFIENSQAQRPPANQSSAIPNVSDDRRIAASLIGNEDVNISPAPGGLKLISIYPRFGPALKQGQRVNLKRYFRVDEGNGWTSKLVPSTSCREIEVFGLSGPLVTLRVNDKQAKVIEDFGHSGATLVLEAVDGTEITSKNYRDFIYEAPRAIPASNSPVQPGDQLVIESLIDSSINRYVVVMSDYTIAVPLVGIVDVKDFSVNAIQDKLNAKFEKYLKDPSIFVARADMTSKQPIKGARGPSSR